MASILQKIQADAAAFGVERKSVSAGPPGGFYGSTYIGGPSTTDSWGAKRAPSPPELVEHFKSLVYSCVMVNANVVSSIPLKLYMDASTGRPPKDESGAKPITAGLFRHLRDAKYVGEGTNVADIREIRDHPFLHALKNPDPYDTLDLTQLIKLIVMYNDVVGAAYLYPEGDPYRWLWALPSQYVLPVFNGGNSIPTSYQYGDRSFDPSELICFRTHLSLKNPYAANYSPLYAAIEYAKLEDKFVSVQEQLLAMGPRPNLIATPADKEFMPGDPERVKFEQELNMRHARSRQGGIMVTTGMWKFQPTSYAPTDLSGLKIAEYDNERICGIIGVPIEYFTSETNLANQQAAAKKHAEFAVNPRCKAIASRLTSIVRKMDYRLFFAFDNPIAADEEKDAKLFDMAVKNGRMTINQSNLETGLPPVPWGDEPWLPNTLSQPSTILKLNEATIKMATAGAIGMAEGGGNPNVGNKDVKKKPKAKGGDEKKKPNASRSHGTGDLDCGGVDRGVLDQGDAAVHGVEGLAEGEDRDPFDYLPWSVDPPSAASD